MWLAICTQKYDKKTKNITSYFLKVAQQQQDQLHPQGDIQGPAVCQPAVSFFKFSNHVTCFPNCKLIFYTFQVPVRQQAPDAGERHLRRAVQAADAVNSKQKTYLPFPHTIN